MGSIGCGAGLFLCLLTYPSKDSDDWVKVLFDIGVFLFVAIFEMSHGPIWYFLDFKPNIAGCICQRYCPHNGWDME